MKARTFGITLIPVLAVWIIIGGCATTSEIKEEREVVQPEVFLQSVGSGDYAEVKRLIEEGADVNAQDKVGWTALLWASHEGRTEVAKLLIEKGVDVNAQDNDGYTALMEASGMGHTEVANLLIEKGPDVNAQGNDEWTALMIASYYGNKEIAKLLIEAGANE